MTAAPTVLSTLELDVLWEAERLGPRHVALSVPSPGTTHSERAELVEKAWQSLASRGLARQRRASGDLLDLLGLLANPERSVDAWVFSDHRITGLAASNGNHAILGVIDGDECWLIPARASSIAESAVSIAGELPAGVGQSVSVPHQLLVDATAQAGNDAHALVTALQDRGVELFDAQELAGMLLGTTTKGQFGVERENGQGGHVRTPHVVAFHDTDAGRYLVQLERSGDDEDWCTITPADNTVLTMRIWELLEAL
ncbi:MAG: ESX secretion-associated protein EspG [Actinophytocola sp.]|nr:ESX secretion-associated protein EspG [Actinophytocola sp.]